MAITTNDRGYIFDFDTVNAVFDELKEVKIDRYFVSEESAKEISRLLGLKNKNTEEELRAVRNAVVTTFSRKRKEECYLDSSGNEVSDDKIDFKRVMYWSNLISGITAVIDSELWHKGFPV